MEEDPAYWEFDAESEAFVPIAGVVNDDENRGESTGSIDGDDGGGDGGLRSMNGGMHVNISKEKALQVVVDAFRSAAEREITIGDGVYVWMMNSVSNKEESDANVEGLRKEAESMSVDISDTDVEKGVSMVRRSRGVGWKKFTTHSMRTIEKSFFSLPGH